MVVVASFFRLLTPLTQTPPKMILNWDRKVVYKKSMRTEVAQTVVGDVKCKAWVVVMEKLWLLLQEN